MEHFEKFDKQLLSSYESTFAVEGREICEEVESLFPDNDELLINNAHSYCLFCTYPKRVDIDKKILEKRRKCLKFMSRYSYIKYSLKDISRSRKMV